MAAQALDSAPLVILTRIWAAILAVLATACLTGMLLLAAARQSDFTDAERAALRASTEAGLAALAVEVATSPVREVSRLRSTTTRPEFAPDQAISPETFTALAARQADELRKLASFDGTLGLLAPDFTLLAVAGRGSGALREALQHPAVRNTAGRDDTVLSVVAEDAVHVVALSASEPSGHRWIATAPLRTTAGSAFRRAIGEGTPAALVQAGRLVSGPVGEAALVEQLENLAVERQLDTPEAGASAVFFTGAAPSVRLGALGRLPDLAGREPNPVLLVTLSPRVLDPSRTDLFGALANAASHDLPVTALVLLCGLLVLSLALAWFLPALEALQPLRRLQHEVDAVTAGKVRQVRPEHFTGRLSEVVRSASQMITTLRQRYPHDGLTDFPDEESTAERPMPLPPEESNPPTTRRPRPPVDESSAKPPSVGDAHSGLRTISIDRAAPPPAPEAPAAVFEPPRPRSGVAPAAVLPRTSLARSGPLPMAFATSGPAEVVDPTHLEPDSAREAYYRSIYEDFVQVKVACGEPTEALTFERFTAKLQRNEDDLRARRNDIKAVRFSVYVKDGRAALKAKVIKQ